MANREENGSKKIPSERSVIDNVMTKSMVPITTIPLWEGFGISRAAQAIAHPRILKAR